MLAVLPSGGIGWDVLVSNYGKLRQHAKMLMYDALGFFSPSLKFL